MTHQLELPYNQGICKLEGRISPENKGFFASTDTLQFIGDTFRAGTIMMQETDRAPVDIEIQRYLAKKMPLLLAQMIIRDIDLNPKREPMIPEDAIDGQKPYSELSNEEKGLAIQVLNQKHKPAPPPHITDHLRPDQIFNPESTRQIEYYTETETARVLKPLGERVWQKLMQKTLETPKEYKGDIHPIDSLKGFNGLLVGLPKTNPETYGEMLEGNRRTLDEIFQLIYYEARHGLLTEKDAQEIYEMLTTKPLTMHEFMKADQSITAVILGHLPMTQELIEKLKLSQEAIVTILAEKLARGDLDETTQLSLKELLEFPENGFIADFILHHPKFKKDLEIRKLILETRQLMEISIARAPTFTNEPLKDEMVENYIRASARKTAKDKIRAADRTAKKQVDENKFLQTSIPEESDEKPTEPITTSFDLANWDPTKDWKPKN
jgi:hypothetical protein